jgi:Holliday junction resolvase-like predicted endonuclease
VLTENDVVGAVAVYLESEGYRIVSKCSTHERGIDIVAEHPMTNMQLLVEAKGGTSSKEGTSNYGNSFTPNQTKTHVSVAFYYAAMLRQKHASKSAQVALAFPDDHAHRLLVDNIASALQTLDILVFFVDSTCRVTTSTHPIIPLEQSQQASLAPVYSDVRSQNELP